MPKMITTGSLVLAAAIAMLGGVVERSFALPRAVVFGGVMLSVLLITYPPVKRNQEANRDLSFKRWALGALLASTVTAAILHGVGLRD
jgi:uncharacterized membrane protein AbrB (regulator of aidB expression)